MSVVEVGCPGQQCCSLLLRAHVHKDLLLMPSIDQSLKWFITLCKVAACGLQDIVRHVVNSLECCLNTDTIKAIRAYFHLWRQRSFCACELCPITVCDLLWWVEKKSSAHHISARHIPILEVVASSVLKMMFIFIVYVHTYVHRWYLSCNCTTTRLCIVSSVT